MAPDPGSSLGRRAELPTGTVTFLFTDIEGSTRLLQELGARYRVVQDQHSEIIRKAIAAGDGVEVRTEGDSFLAVFQSPPGAVVAAVQAQRDLATHEWPHGAPLRVRIGMHTGEGVLGGGDYIGIDVNLAARISAAASGGQVLLSNATRGLVENSLPDDVRLRDLGEHRLKDIEHPQQLHDLEIDGVPSEFPAPRTLDSRPSNLPEQLTSFVGREQEIGDVVERLKGSRLLTLVGPGGTGKTRLAVEAANRALPDFPDGAWFVDLAPVSDPALVPTAIAASLGLPEQPSQPALDTLKAHFADKKLLLILDNFEQVLEAASAVDSLLSAAPELRVLVTSRQPLHLYGEQELPIPPLDLPPHAEELGIDALSGFDSVTLFLARARSVRPDFTLNEGNTAAVAAICRRLDGLPLAIELAAARVKLLGPDAILERLERTLPQLTATASNVPERQRTLRSTLAWSYDLLEEGERRLFARLSLFNGGASLEAVREVAGEGAGDTEDLVEALVDKSLVRAADDVGAGPRVTMLQTIREFAAERLADTFDEGEERRRHAEWFVRFAEEMEPRLDRAAQAEWLDRCELEHDNVRTALRFLLDSGDLQAVFRICRAVWRFWQQRGHLREGSAWTEEALAMPGPRDGARFAGFTAAGNLAYWQSDLEGTKRNYEAALDLARELEDRHKEMEALHNASFLRVMLGNPGEAVMMLEQARALARELDDSRMLSRITADIGWAALLGGDPVGALARFEEAMESSRALGDPLDEAEIRLALGLAARTSGDRAGARKHVAGALEILGEAGELIMLIGAFEGLGELASSEGRHDPAVRLLAAATALREVIEGGPPPLLPLEDVLPNARTALGIEAADGLFEEGKRMPLGDAMDLAMEEASGG